MICKKEIFPHGLLGYRCVYTADSLHPRKNALVFAAEAFVKLPFEEKCMHIDDGLNFHEGTISEDFREIDNCNEFVEQFLRSPIYLIMIIGVYQTKRIYCSIHLNKSKIVITCSDTQLVQEIEKILELTIS